ncbi:hypothetical protein BOTCAL_0001g00830 [Botryotinia calthae]|uniref:Uncharacterized protein n=1 Tax=Botryotinia calthae TaxID=38488 RepID=A0A4Y8DI86_9HELO|nr:hypothetical protein BOTCAL_0001g00830 [Botryotinia calthae]
MVNGPLWRVTCSAAVSGIRANGANDYKVIQHPKENFCTALTGSNNGLTGIRDAMPASERGLDLKGRRPISATSQNIGKHLFE